MPIFQSPLLLSYCVPKSLHLSKTLTKPGENLVFSPSPSFATTKKANSVLAVIGHLPPTEGLSEGKVPFPISKPTRLIPRNQPRKNAQLSISGLNLSVPFSTDLSWLVKDWVIVYSWIWKEKRKIIKQVVRYSLHVHWVFKAFSADFLHLPQVEIIDISFRKTSHLVETEQNCVERAHLTWKIKSVWYISMSTSFGARFLEFKSQVHRLLLPGPWESYLIYASVSSTSKCKC